MYKCERCGNRTGSWQPVRLCGAYLAELCHGCVNDWESHVIHMPKCIIYRSSRNEKQRLEMSMRGGLEVPSDRYDTVCGDVTEAEHEMSFVAKAFCEAKIEREGVDDAK